jgi:hypothetical protein
MFSQLKRKVPNKSAVLNFDLRDLQKQVKSKTLVLCHVSLLDLHMIKNFEMILES